MMARFKILRLARLGDQIDAEALLGHFRRLDDAINAAVSNERHLRAFQRGNDRGGEADDAGGAEHGDLRALPALVEFGAQHALDAGDHGRGRGERAGRVGESRQAERWHQRLLGGIHHIEGQNGVLAADEQTRAHSEVRRTREDGVLRQRSDLLERHVDVGDDNLPTGIRCHVHVEGRHMLLW